MCKLKAYGIHSHGTLLFRDGLALYGVPERVVVEANVYAERFIRVANVPAIECWKQRLLRLTFHEYHLSII